MRAGYDGARGEIYGFRGIVLYIRQRPGIRKRSIIYALLWGARVYTHIYIHITRGGKAGECRKASAMNDLPSARPTPPQSLSGLSGW